MIDYILKMMNFAFTNDDGLYTKTDGFYTKHDGIYTKTDRLYTKTDGLKALYTFEYAQLMEQQGQYGELQSKSPTFFWEFPSKLHRVWRIAPEK